MKKVPRWLFWVAVAFVALNGADAVLTYTIVSHGLGRESNPLIAPIAGNIWLLLPMKVGITAALGALAMRRYCIGSKAWIGICFWTTVYVGIVSWNARHLVVAWT